MYQTQAGFGLQKDLTNTHCWWISIIQKQHQKTIHVAGNQMAVLLASLASVLRRGYKVGLYTPHFKKILENELKSTEKIFPKTIVCNFINQHKFFLNNTNWVWNDGRLVLGLFWEWESGYCHYRSWMGGRLDSTNNFSFAITNIDWSLHPLEYVGINCCWRKSWNYQGVCSLLLVNITRHQKIFIEKQKREKCPFILPLI
jgi:hypothetical protein